MIVKRRTFLVVLGLLLLIGLVGVATAGQEIQVQYFGSPEEVRPVTSIAIDAPKQLQAVNPLDENESKTPQEIEMLVTRWSTAMMNGSGWLHVVNHYSRNRDQTGVLPNGQSVPLNYINDTWYQLNDQGLAIAVIAFMKSEDGQLQQVATFRDGVWRNLTFGDKYSGEVFAPQLDFGMGKYLAQRAQSHGGLVGRQEKTVDSRATVVFTAQDAFANPAVIAGYDKQAARVETSAGFDLQTGRMLYLEHIMVTPDGERRLVERVDIQMVERVSELPNEIFTFLNQEVAQ